jgi:hypothetical protein
MNGTETPEPQAAPITLTRYHILCWPIADCKTKGDGAIPNWQLETWSKHDVIVRHNL